MFIAILGDHDGSKRTHRAIDLTCELLEREVRLGWVTTDEARPNTLEGAAGVWLAPGTPYRNAERVHAAIRDALHDGRPLLATCGGFQHVAVELARTLAGIPGAAHAESEPHGATLVVAPLSCSLQGEHRPVQPVAGTRLARACGVDAFPGFHMCGYGVAERYVSALERAGVVVSARSEDASVEALELPRHPFFVATLFQPQVDAAESGNVHPLVRAFVDAALSGGRARS